MIDQVRSVPRDRPPSVAVQISWGASVSRSFISLAFAVAVVVTPGVAAAAPACPAPTVRADRLFNAGRPCDTGTPVAAGHFAGTLQALAESSGGNLSVEFAVWPVDAPADRLAVTEIAYQPGSVTTTQLPESALDDGRTYAWQARAHDGARHSAWSPTCLVAVDRTAPPAPAVTSDNYPAFPGVAPLGEPGRFRFDGAGVPDVAGFEHAFDLLPVPGCESGGDVGQLVCPAPFSGASEVRADQPGGVADVLVNGRSTFSNRLLVRSIDAAGNRSGEVEVRFRTPASSPSVTVVGPAPSVNDEVTLQLAPRAGVGGTTSFEYRVDGGDPATVDAAPDGTATVTVSATGSLRQVTVRSRSANGFVSHDQTWNG